MKILSFLFTVSVCHVLNSCNSSQGLYSNPVEGKRSVSLEVETLNKFIQVAQNMGKTIKEGSFRGELGEYLILLNEGGLLYTSKDGEILYSKLPPIGLPSKPIDGVFEEKPKGVELPLLKGTPHHNQ